VDGVLTYLDLAKRRGEGVTTWRLVQGETLLGTLAAKDVDQPFYRTTFEPTSAFEPLRPLFDEELRLMDAIDPDREDWTAWGAAYSRIERLGLRLEPLDGGDPITEFLLHVSGRDAWFRY